MFDLGWTELLVIAVVAIIVVGPKDLPKLMRSVGRWVRKARRMAAEFQEGLEDMVRDDELTSIKRDMEDMTKLERYDPTGPDKAKTDKAKTGKTGSGAAQTADSKQAKAASKTETGGSGSPADAETTDAPGRDSAGDTTEQASTTRSSAKGTATETERDRDTAAAGR